MLRERSSKLSGGRSNPNTAHYMASGGQPIGDRVAQKSRYVMSAVIGAHVQSSALRDLKPEDYASWLTCLLTYVERERRSITPTGHDQLRAVS